MNGVWIAIAILAGWMIVSIVLLPWTLDRIARRLQAVDLYDGLTVDEVRLVTRPMSRPGFRVDAAGRVFYSADWLDDWMSDDPA